MDTGCNTHTVGDFECFQGFPEILPLEELAIGMGEAWWSMIESVGSACTGCNVVGVGDMVPDLL